MSQTQIFKSLIYIKNHLLFDYIHFYIYNYVILNHLTSLLRLLSVIFIINIYKTSIYNDKKTFSSKFKLYSINCFSYVF